MPSAGRQYRSIYVELRRIFDKRNVKDEWNAAKDAKDWMQQREHLYAPRLDFAVGPFNIDNSTETNVVNIDNRSNEFTDLINILKVRSLLPDGINFNQNTNPRCFIAIEIESTTSRKHRLGSIVNVSALGKIGIVLGKDEKVSKSLVNLQNYLTKTDEYGKSTLMVKNVIVLTKSDFLNALQGYER